MKLEAIDWSAALRQGSERHQAGGGPTRPVLADAQSLSALFTVDYAEGLGRLRRARTADPLNPLHALRAVLLRLRFGQWETALTLCQSLQEALPTSLPTYLRALATLGQEELKRAANLAQEVLQADPQFRLAQFLQVEASLRASAKAGRQLLSRLPSGPAFAPAWADLLVKVLLGGSEEGGKLARQILADRKALPAESKARALATQVLAWHDADSDQLEQALAALRPGSCAEEVLLHLVHDRVQKEAALKLVRRLRERFPDRPAVRRLQACLLTRRAMADAAADRYIAALRVVEGCLQLEPFETIHYQNRAALFTLMREPDAYHAAWLELNRHQYRLALLGKFSPADALQLAKPHRLFAEQARFSSRSPDGRRAQDSAIFAEEKVGDETSQVVNQKRLDEDPELLRQWIHHRRAELVFSHWALGGEARRVPLYPEDPRVARARFAGLTLATRSLATLVPEEGQLLADRVVGRWSALVGRVSTSYSPAPDDSDVQRLQALYMEALGDIALLCLKWSPDGRRPEIVEELLEFLDSAGPFFDESALRVALKAKSGTPDGVLVLKGFAYKTLGLEAARDTILTTEQCGQVIDHLGAYLLDTLSYQVYNADARASDRVQRALILAERARKLEPNNPEYQFTTARFLGAGGYYEDAKAIVALAQRSPRAREPAIAERLEKLRKSLEGKEEADGLLNPLDQVFVDMGGGVNDRVALLERELAEAPSSIQAYEDLVRVLVALGRFEDALDWSDRAMAHCLAREAQYRARLLNLEAQGLQVVAQRDQNAVQLYLNGVHRPALEIIESIPDGERRPYPLSYLLGRCLLALNRPEEARVAFESALGRCQRQLHRPILRRLAQDIDQAYLMLARRAVLQKLQVKAFDAALQEAAEMMSRLRRPELGFLDLARIHYEAALANLGQEQPTRTRPAILEVPGWDDALSEAYAAPSDLAASRLLVCLALEVDPVSRQQAEQLGQKIEALAPQEGVAVALVRSRGLREQGRFEDALAALDATGPDAAGEARIQRQRALLLLKLERFEEADAVVEAQHDSRAAGTAEFLATYGALAFRQRLDAAVQRFRRGSEAEAAAILAGARPKTAEETLEWGYCRACCRTRTGYRLRQQGRKAEARQALAQALAETERLLPSARALGYARLLELYATLDDEVAKETTP